MLRIKLKTYIYFSGQTFGCVCLPGRGISSYFVSSTSTARAAGVHLPSNVCTNASSYPSTNSVLTSCIIGHRTRTMQRDFHALCGWFGGFNTSKYLPISSCGAQANQVLHLRKFYSSKLLSNTMNELNKGNYENQDNSHVHKDKIKSKRLFGPYEYEFDINGYLAVDDVVKFLRQEAAYDICVIKTSGAKRAYVDYFIVASGVSNRHIRAMSKNLEHLFKGRNIRGISKQGCVTVEGLEGDSSWLAVDIGNMVVHFFLPEVRQIYELEKLWTLGPKYDDQYRALHEEEDFLQAVFLGEKTKVKNTEMEE